MARSLASNASNATKPKPLLRLVISSHMMFGGLMIVPNAEKVSYSNFSSTSDGSRLPMKRFAPTSSVPDPDFLSSELLLTRIGRLNSFTMLMIWMA